MTDTLKLEIVSPLRKQEYSGVEKVWIPGKAGEMTIYPNHDSMIVEYVEGDLSLFFEKKDEEKIKLDSGFAVIEADKVVIYT